jgi:excisionase family DNA binding protein
MQDLKENPTSRSRGRGHRYQTVAKILDVSVRHVIREVERGKLKVTFVGPRQPRIFDDELDRYVQGGRR